MDRKNEKRVIAPDELFDVLVDLVKGVYDKQGEFYPSVALLKIGEQRPQFYKVPPALMEGSGAVQIADAMQKMAVCPTTFAVAFIAESTVLTLKSDDPTLHLYTEGRLQLTDNVNSRSVVSIIYSSKVGDRSAILSIDESSKRIISVDKIEEPVEVRSIFARKFIPNMN